MPYYTEKQIDQARSIDLLTYLQSFEPTELVHVRGNTYCTREHDSDAMKILTKEGTDLHDTDAKISRKPDCDVKRKLLLPDKSETNFEVIRYLTSRGIDSDVIKACIDEGLLYESLPYHNCIFVGFDETGNAAYAFYRATTGERLMGEAAGSDKRYSFRIDRAGSTLHVFESAIDLLSYATIMKMRTGEWRAEPMLSLGENMGKDVSGEKPELTGPPDKVLFLSLNKEIKIPDKKGTLPEEPIAATDNSEAERSVVIWDESRLDFLDTEERDKVLASASELRITETQKTNGTITTSENDCLC